MPNQKQSEILNFLNGLNWQDFATEKMGIKVAKGKQQPYRPARWRHIYEDALIAAGIDPVIIDIFKGTVNRSGKPYPGKSREELEYFYEMVEPNLTIDYQEDESDMISKLQEQLEEERQKSNEQINKTIEEMKQQREQDKLDTKKTVLDILKKQGIIEE